MRMIPLSRPNITEEDIACAVAVLRTGQLVQGRHVAEFQDDVSAFFGGPHVRAVSNGTAALHLALVALGIGPGDEVIVPAFSFVATANVVELVGATPIFVDIDLATFNVNVDHVEAAVTARTRAIMPVHEFGLVSDIERIVAIAERHGIPVIEDAACALGATSGGRYAGTFGTFGCFSLDPRKAVTAGEGGLVVTASSALANQIEVLRNHGIADVDHAKEFIAAGFNYRLTDFQAALVRSQFARLQRNIEYRAELAAVYQAHVASSVASIPTVPHNKMHTWQTFHVVLNSSIDRAEAMHSLSEAGIQTSIGAQCIPAQVFYRAKYGFDSRSAFPNAHHAWKHGLALPMSESLTLDDVEYVAEHINRIST